MGTRTITIVCHDDRGTFDIFEGEEYQSGLNWNGTLGLVAHLTHPELRYGMSLGTVDEHQDNAIAPPSPPREMWAADFGATEDDYLSEFREIPF